ncbi:YqzE family protein [Paenibacillus sp. 481]|uniref:YqzE family protein n=1 Tax=Paenibacillus sp. 481 TaxID=2835869 RepID=UPI001E3E7061|nr:YqzE family protein [Paenibacillus sp. 481]UHA72680.1 YqzE family protein [Paenibacillus sp. 481]
MAKSDDFIKFITQRVVTYMETPEETRREKKMERKQRTNEAWITKWFGLLPLSLSMWAKTWGSFTKPLWKRASLVVWRRAR